MLSSCLPAPFALWSRAADCSPDVLFWQGALLGLLALAGLFNLLLLFANPRNISHLVFSIITLLAALASIAAPARPVSGAGTLFTPAPGRLLDLQIYGIWLPVLLFWFHWILFPALRQSMLRGQRLPVIDGAWVRLPSTRGTRAPRYDYWIFGCYRLAAYMGVYLLTPAGLILSFGAVQATDGNGVTLAAYAAAGRIYFALSIAATAGVIVTAVCFGQQGSRVALLGYLAFLTGMALELHAGTGMPSAGSTLRPALVPGLLGFVLAMVVLMGPYRYQMHRQLRRSRDALHTSNRKLRHLDALKNRYITGSAREMQAPLKRVMEHCMEIVEDPAYRLSHSQLRALSAVMDMARRMIRRNERAARLFQEAVLAPETFVIQEFLEMLCVVLEEQYRPWQFKLRLPAKLANAGDLQVYADRTLLESALQELADNAARHGPAPPDGRAIEITLAIESEARDRQRVRVAFHEPAGALSARQLSDLTDEFRTGPTGRPGIGLGLSLVRRIAELHGSELQIATLDQAKAENSRRTGNAEQDRPIPYATIFSFTLPLAVNGFRHPEMVSAAQHVRFLLRLRHHRQAQTEARTLVLRYPEFRAELEPLLAELESSGDQSASASSSIFSAMSASVNDGSGIDANT